MQHTVERPEDREQRPFTIDEAGQFLASWCRVVAADGSTVAYAPDAVTAGIIAECAGDTYDASPELADAAERHQEREMAYHSERDAPACGMCDAPATCAAGDGVVEAFCCDACCSHDVGCRPIVDQIGPFPAEPAFGSPEAVERAAHVLRVLTDPEVEDAMMPEPSEPTAMEELAEGIEREWEAAAVQQAAEWFVAHLRTRPGGHLSELTPLLPAVLEPNREGGAFYVGQFNREEDAVLCSAAREMVNALEACVRDMEHQGYVPPSINLARAALQKAGRLGGGR